MKTEEKLAKLKLIVLMHRLHEKVDMMNIDDEYHICLLVQCASL